MFLSVHTKAKFLTRKKVCRCDERGYMPLDCHFDFQAIAHSIVKQGHVDAVKQMNALKLQQAQPVT